MFDYIGDKIKMIAIIQLIIIGLGSVIGGIVCLAEGLTGIGLALLIGGVLDALLNTFLLYGFGQLIEDTQFNRYTNEQILKQMKTAEETKKSAQ